MADAQRKISYYGFINYPYAKALATSLANGRICTMEVAYTLLMDIGRNKEWAKKTVRGRVFTFPESLLIDFCAEHPGVLLKETEDALPALKKLSRDIKRGKEGGIWKGKEKQAKALLKEDGFTAERVLAFFRSMNEMSDSLGRGKFARDYYQTLGLVLESVFKSEPDAVRELDDEWRFHMCCIMIQDVFKYLK